MISSTGWSANGYFSPIAACDKSIRGSWRKCKEAYDDTVIEGCLGYGEQGSGSYWGTVRCRR